ncbi:MAG TPA: alpha-amylase family glycosyl hydrolase [Kiritimatiellia bacterium]|nr:alpha-amylase family glycosyl hydrolase [Kiritimatiellia bacterium]HNS81248.1 alpha-amylase family glycosyl hydrolase [Kiritimatiellia bacterium]
MRVKRLIWAVLLVAGLSRADVILTPSFRALPGETEPTPWLLYRNVMATGVVVCGSWSDWSTNHAMILTNGIWQLDVRPLELPFGQHRYKFVVNGQWEPGADRFFYASGDNLLEKPSDWIVRAAIQDRRRIEVFLKNPLASGAGLEVRLEPGPGLEEWHFASGAEGGRRQGYAVVQQLVSFYFDEKLYGLDISSTTLVTVAGNFNGWNPQGGDRWRLTDPDNDGIWEGTAHIQGLRPPAGEREMAFKFVLNGKEWLPVLETAPNVLDDGRGNANLHLDLGARGSSSLIITTAEDIDLSFPPVVAIDGLQPRTVRQAATPGELLDKMFSDKPLGVTLDKEQGATTYRIFAPRAREVHLCLFDLPQYEIHKPAYKRLKPSERYPLWKDPADGVWEITLMGLDEGRWYSFNVDGPRGEGEGFYPEGQIGDPYARAAAHAENNTIVIDPDAPNKWFKGWTDQDFVTPPLQDIVIYEAHVRDLTAHPSSGVPAPLRGLYEGIAATSGTGTGLDHIRDMGFNAIELLPVCEFNNGERDYNWGYSTVFYFAPEASYAQEPVRGSQYYEFKALVNELHRQGFAVILDVVYNHVGSPNIFHMLDKKYYFRLNADYSYINFSGCGNDVRTEAPMMRRLITDNIRYWMEEFHVDGFRLDLAELIDMDTMLAIRDTALSINTNAILISEPWSFRGENKQELKGTGWSAWNNDFRYAAKDFVSGRHNRDWLQKQIFGSVETWAADPLQPVNYLESHDDMALADELCTRPDRDGRNLQQADVDVNRLAATILFTSLGVPMVAEGQEFLRSKHGHHNTYDKGDGVNALNWKDRDRPMAAEAMAYYRGLSRLRGSPQGAAFRVRSRPPADYFQWILPPHPQLLGYIVNAGRVHDGASFIVLLNASSSHGTFPITFPEGQWKQISDGRRLDMAGLPGAPVIKAPVSTPIPVPGLHAAIFMDGF